MLTTGRTATLLLGLEESKRPDLDRTDSLGDASGTKIHVSTR